MYTPLQGLVVGILNTVLTVVVLVLGVMAAIIVLQVIGYVTGRMRFMDLGPAAQWVVLTFFNGDGDGFA
jgi:hypothetical protein